jgi:phage-related minor tail protein
MADEEIKVLLTADPAQLQAGMEAGAASVQASTDAMQASVTEAATSMSAAQTDMASATTANAAAWADLASNIDASVDQAKAKIAQMAVAAKASVGGMEEAAASSAAAMSATSGVVADAVGKEKTALALLFDALSGNTKTVEALVAQRAALASIQEAGSQSATTLADATARLDAAAIKLGVTEADLAVATEGATVATDVNTEAMVVNSRVAGELGTILSEALSGNFGRIRRSAAALANQTGLLQKAFTGMGPAILGVAGAIVAFGVALVKGSEEQAKFNGALLMTGGSTGVLSGALQDMAEHVGEASGSFGNAREAMLSIVESGRIAGAQMEQVGIAAQQMAKLTGDSVQKSVDTFIKLQEKPVQAVVALNDQYHFLTQSVFDQIAALQQQGDTEEAAKVATDAYAQALQQRTDQVEANLGTLARTWDSVKNSASWAWDAMLNVGKTDTLQDKIGAAQTALENFQKMGLVNFNEKAGHAGWETTDEGKHDSAAQYEIENLKNLQAQLNAEQDKATAKAKDTAQVKQYTDDALALEKWNAKLKDNDNLQAQISDRKAKVEKVHKEAPNSPELKGYTFDASGAVTGGEQWAATVAKLTKEYSNAGSEARKAAQEAKKAAGEQMNDLEMVRAGTAANTAERIQSDAAILASATKLYGANSQQQKAALSQMLADSKAYGAEVIRDDNEQAAQLTQAAITAAQSQLGIASQKIAAAYNLHQISKQQELAQLAAANDAEYTLEVQAYAKQLNLLDLTVKARQQVNAEIEKLQLKHEVQMQKIQDDAAIANQQMWEKRLQPINNAFNRSINGMIQGTQTLRQSMNNMLSSILASYLETIVKSTTQWLAGELAKTSATVSGNAVRTAANTAASKEGMAQELMLQEKQIFNAAKVAAANTFSSVAAIPVVGPELAPFAAAGAFVAVEAFGNLSSAAGGWERVPFDGAMTELHRDEMVLPKHVADPIRQMAQGGGGGGGGQVHIHANDAKSFKDMLRRNPGALAGALRHAGRMGH